MDPLHPLPRLLPSAGRSQEGCTRGRPFKSASLRLQAAQADGPQLLRRHQSRPPGPDRVAGGAGEPGGRQVWADSPFIPRLGRAQTSGRPCSPCGACLYRAWRPGEGRGCGERGAREAAPWGPADTEPPSWPDCVTSGLSLPSSVPRLPQQPSSLPRKPLHSVRFWEDSLEFGLLRSRAGSWGSPWRAATLRDGCKQHPHFTDGKALALGAHTAS